MIERSGNNTTRNSDRRGRPAGQRPTKVLGCGRDGRRPDSANAPSPSSDGRTDMNEADAVCMATKPEQQSSETSVLWHLSHFLPNAQHNRPMNNSVRGGGSQRRQLKALVNRKKHVRAQQESQLTITTRKIRSKISWLQVCDRTTTEHPVFSHYIYIHPHATHQNANAKRLGLPACIELSRLADVPVTHSSNLRMLQQLHTWQQNSRYSRWQSDAADLTSLLTKSAVICSPIITRWRNCSSTAWPLKD